MTCQKCSSRSFVKDTVGTISCINCGLEAGVATRRHTVPVKTCSKGHPMLTPPCYVCKDSIGRSSPSVNAAQREAVAAAVPKQRAVSPAIFPNREETKHLVRALGDRGRTR